MTTPARGPGRPFAKSNPGRPKGARNRATVAAEALLDGEAEALTRKAIELAIAGDTIALRLCLERVLPPRRERPIRFRLPPLKSAADSVAAIGAIIAAVGEGRIAPGEAEAMARLVDTFIRAVETTEIEQRLLALEARQDAQPQP
jgi:hypothetical protein